MIFEIKGAPQGKARARTFYNKNMGKMQSITPEKTKDYESLIRWSYTAAGGVYLGTNYIKIGIQAIYQIPQSWSKKKRETAISGYLLPQKKPDCDNIAKAVLDALNGVAYLDDSQVVMLQVKKIFGVEPRILVNIDTVEV